MTRSADRFSSIYLNGTRGFITISSFSFEVHVLFLCSRMPPESCRSLKRQQWIDLRLDSRRAKERGRSHQRRKWCHHHAEICRISPTFKCTVKYALTRPPFWRILVDLLGSLPCFSPFPFTQEMRHPTTPISVQKSPQNLCQDTVHTCGPFEYGHRLLHITCIQPELRFARYVYPCRHSRLRPRVLPDLCLQDLSSPTGNFPSLQKLRKPATNWIQPVRHIHPYRYFYYLHS